MKGSVRMKLLVPSIAMLVLCMGVSSYFSSQKSAHEASQVLVGTARLAAQDVSKNLDDMLSFVCNVLALESGNEILDGLLTDKGPSESEFNDGVKLLKKLVATSNLVSAARVYNTQGKCIVSDTGITNIDVKDRDYFKKVMTGQTNISNPLINRANNLPVCVISTPIIREGKITGALIVGIDLSPFTENMNALRDSAFLDLGHTKFDTHRALRNGFPEVVYAEGKTPEQVAEIFCLPGTQGNILATRVSPEMASHAPAHSSAKTG
jgi:NCAIR mutase (PurE)-related proteins